MNKEDIQYVTMKAHIDTAALDEVAAKVERLNKLLKEANSLAGELASREINLPVNVK